MSNSRHKKVDAVVIGAGHAGLAVSHNLTERSIDHLVIERGEVANSWRHERWDSLKLLTPNWQSQLPGYENKYDDPDGFMSTNQVIEFIDNYARHIQAPLKTGTNVNRLGLNSNGYEVETDKGTWHCKAVVVASGACNVPSVPKIADAIPADISQLTSSEYRNPDQLEEGGVLIVGASSTGLQLAQEIHRSGRPVRIAVGEHVKIPRTYRGKDIYWWMDAAGILDEGLEEIDDVNRARHLPSPQLIGSYEQQLFDLNAMTRQGIKLHGRLMGFNNGNAQFSGSLKNVCALADLKINRLLNAIDEWAEQSPDSASFETPERFDSTETEDSPELVLNLAGNGIKTILWATGYKPDFSWLDVPVLDRKGMIIHEGGVAKSEGMYVVGMPFLRSRRSSFIHGAQRDAHHIAKHLQAFVSQ
jgi:putative flavoprotein involved in K+ transport